MTDLEDQLRTMLRERAGDIDALPARLYPASEPEDVLDLAPAMPRRRHATSPRRTGWLLAAAAVTALGVTAGAIALSTSDDPRPDRSPAAPLSSATGPVTPSPAVLRECQAELPSGWNALRNGVTSAYQATDTALDVRPEDGAVLVGRDDTRTRTVELVTPG